MTEKIIINDDNQWECPACHNKDQTKMNVTRRTCGYLGENYWNVGKTKEIKSRVLHSKSIRNEELGTRNWSVRLCRTLQVCRKARLQGVPSSALRPPRSGGT